MAHAKHRQVRARYNALCGYCGVAEDDARGELTVDHYVPVVAGGDDSDDNLVYACFRCNQYKSDYRPSVDDRANGHYVLHPRHDNLLEHLQLDETTGRLTPLTESGRFNITLLHLNRPALITYRLRRRHQELLAARKDLVEAENRELRVIVNAQGRYIAHLKNLVDGQSETP